MISNVTQVIENVKAAEDESLKAIRALESALESIGQDLQTFYEENDSVPEATPEDLLKVNRSIAEATAKAVAASLSKNQEDVVAVANSGRKVVGDLIRTVKVCWNFINKSL